MFIVTGRSVSKFVPAETPGFHFARSQDSDRLEDLISTTGH